MHEILRSTLLSAWAKFHIEIFPFWLWGDVRKRRSCINLKKSNSGGRGGVGVGGKRTHRRVCCRFLISPEQLWSQVSTAGVQKKNNKKIKMGTVRGDVLRRRVSLRCAPNPSGKTCYRDDSMLCFSARPSHWQSESPQPNKNRLGADARYLKISPSLCV